MLAGVGCGLFGGLEEAAQMRGPGTTFEPRLDANAREARLHGWRGAVSAVINGIAGEDLRASA
jgi:glycerol kinase